MSLQEEELNATAIESSQDSTEPWDTVFNRATNAYKKRDKGLPPSSASCVSDFGTSMKFKEYYKEDAKKRRKRKNQDKAAVAELKMKVQTLEEKAVDQKTMDKLVEEKLRSMIPPEFFEGLTAWNAGGRQGPIHLPSLSGSNSGINVTVSLDLVTPPAVNVGTQPLVLVTPTPPPAKDTNKAQPTATVLREAPEREIADDDRPAAGIRRVSTLAEIHAITKVTN